VEDDEEDDDFGRRCCFIVALVAEYTVVPPTTRIDMIEATEAIALWASSPPMPELMRARLLTTFSAAWEVADPMAARNPSRSKETELNEAIATPIAIGMSEKSASLEGNASNPCNRSMIKTVISGIEHLLVYVKLIPIRLNDMLLK